MCTQAQGSRGAAGLALGWWPSQQMPQVSSAPPPQLWQPHGQRGERVPTGVPIAPGGLYASGTLPSRGSGGPSAPYFSSIVGAPWGQSRSGLSWKTSRLSWFLRL